MSGKVQKNLRKLAREELDKRMQPNQQPQQTRQINILVELQQFITSCQLLTGEMPASITMTDAMYNAYIQTVQGNAEDLGLNPGFKTGEPIFLGVKLVKKSPLIVPNPAGIDIAPPTPEVKPN